MHTNTLRNARIRKGIAHRSRDIPERKTVLPKGTGYGWNFDMRPEYGFIENPTIDAPDVLPAGAVYSVRRPMEGPRIV